MKRSLVGFAGCSVLAISFCCGDAHPVHAADRGVQASPNPVFVTSVTGTGDLSTWADTGGISGLAGADMVCRARATAAGLTDANLFVAWLSDSSNDAYCRIHQMSGTKASNCGGLPSLPSFAGPWARTDGHPFGEKIHLLLGIHGVIYIPALLDEYGATAPSTRVFTATDSNGEYDGAASAGCSDWTSADPLMVPGGDTLRTTQSWTRTGQIGCQSSWPLLCMLSAEGPDLTPLHNQGALAFMTSSTGNGRLEDWAEAGGYQGLDAADNICLLRAIAADLPHPEEFKAWLSTSMVNATDRFTFGGPWVRPDGVIVAHTKAELISGELHAPINQTEFGEYYGNFGAWTGSTAAGVGSGFHCNDWTSDNGGDTGSAGAVNSIYNWWESPSPSPCTSIPSLYCLSNVPSAIRIFFDGFETGDLNPWSVTQP